MTIHKDSNFLQLRLPEAYTSLFKRQTQTYGLMWLRENMRGKKTNYFLSWTLHETTVK